ncbi:MAG: hypothetical protein FWD26_05310 [Treponema sp.]|nr:hypothetical protein [Treponema sp.]
MNWQVIYNRGKFKKKRLPSKVAAAMELLVSEIEKCGPVRGNWSNYSKLPNNKHHCHLKKGKPTYVAVWEDIGKNKVKLVEIIYVGTHEKAPY